MNFNKFQLLVVSLVPMACKTGSSTIAFAYQVQSPQYKPQNCQKKKKNTQLFSST
jgi:hypothetical protein